jgi:hypothetical protein
LQSIFDTIFDHANRLCGAKIGALMLFEQNGYPIFGYREEPPQCRGLFLRYVAGHRPAGPDAIAPLSSLDKYDGTAISPGAASALLFRNCSQAAARSFARVWWRSEAAAACAVNAAISGTTSMVRIFLHMCHLHFGLRTTADFALGIGDWETCFLPQLNSCS